MSRHVPVLRALRAAARPGGWLGALLLVAGLLLPAAAHVAPDLLCAKDVEERGEGAPAVCEVLLASIAPALAGPAPLPLPQAPVAPLLADGVGTTPVSAARSVTTPGARAPPR